MDRIVRFISRCDSCPQSQETESDCEVCAQIDGALTNREPQLHQHADEEQVRLEILIWEDGVHLGEEGTLRLNVNGRLVFE